MHVPPATMRIIVAALLLACIAAHKLYLCVKGPSARGGDLAPVFCQSEVAKLSVLKDIESEVDAGL